MGANATPRGAPRARAESTISETEVSHEGSQPMRDYATALQIGVDIETGPSFER